MNKETIATMLNKGYNSEDSKIAKVFLIKHYRDILEKCPKNEESLTLYKGELEKIGIKIEGGGVSFHKQDFPELWEPREE